MKRPETARGSSCALTVAFSLLLCMGAASLAWSAPPAKGTCDQADAYEKLKCKHDNAAKQIEFMTGLFNEGTLLGDQITEGQRGQMKAVKAKSERSRNKSAANDFKKLAKSEAKSNKNACFRVPFAAQDDVNPADGYCDYDQGNQNAKCAAIDLDANGNKLVCNPQKKNKGKGQDGLECDQICSDNEALTSTESQEMLAEAQPMDQAYGALETELYQVNGDLETLNSSGSTLLVSQSVSASPDSCETPASTPGLDIAAGILRQVSVTARGLAGMSSTGCEQTAVALGFGGNGSVVCLIFETAASILEIAYTTVDEILKAEESTLQSSTLACLQQTAGGIDAGFANLYNQHTGIKNNDNANTARILTKIDQVRSELVRLLTTPQGRRDQFPSK